MGSQLESIVGVRFGNVKKYTYESFDLLTVCVSGKVLWIVKFTFFTFVLS
jgi:hypothetical protein